MEKENAKAAIEAVLFAEGESVDLETIAAAIGEEKEETEQLLNQMLEDYQEKSRGIELIKLDNAWQLRTKASFYETLIRVEKQPKKENLTDVMMETLSIIAYKQPVTRLEIEKIRGVKSDHAINRLIEYDLIQELGRLDAPGRPILFGTTQEFLRHFGLQSLDDLPEMDTVKMEDFKAQAEEEAQEKIEV